jgi:hypothetical protein
MTSYLSQAGSMQSHGAEIHEGDYVGTRYRGGTREGYVEQLSEGGTKARFTTQRGKQVGHRRLWQGISYGCSCFHGSCGVCPMLHQQQHHQGLDGRMLAAMTYVSMCTHAAVGPACCPSGGAPAVHPGQGCGPEPWRH